MLLLTLFATLLPATLAVKCYICSWSPKDAQNRTVICSDEHFTANGILISDCDSGCETYFQWDRNGAMEQLRRNCLHSENSASGECKHEETKAFVSKRCTCVSDLCNAALSSYISSAVPVILFALASILRNLHYV